MCAGKPNTKWMQTMIEKHGSREAVLEIQRNIASRGGQARYPGKGFAANPELARIAGVKGGRISRRRPKTTV